MTATQHDMLNPLHGKYVPVAGDVVMFSDAPDSANRRRPYTVTAVSWWMGDIRGIRVEAEMNGKVHEYDLDGLEWLWLKPGKVGKR